MLFDKNGKNIKDTELFLMLEYFINDLYGDKNDPIESFVELQYVPARKKTNIYRSHAANGRVYAKFMKHELYLQELVHCFDLLGYKLDIGVTIKGDELLTKFVKEYCDNFYDRIYIVLAMNIIEYKDIYSATSMTNYSTVNEMFSKVKFKQDRMNDAKRVNITNAIYTKRLFEYMINATLSYKYPDRAKDPIEIDFTLKSKSPSDYPEEEEKRIDEYLNSEISIRKKSTESQLINAKAMNKCNSYGTMLNMRKEDA